ncbi:hypothetical protein OAH12_01845 [Cyclobacteriaceae bacterium]|nr:hypothetical protein [Cyclobacteriaceae bacterium]
MKTLFTSLFLFVSFVASAALMQINGKYKGQNLIVRNPYVEATKSYSITSIYLNEKELELDLNHLTVEVYFSKYLKLGDAVSLRVYYASGAKPTVVNPSVIKQRSLFAFNQFTVSEKEFKWSCRGEAKGAHYEVERLEEGKWAVVDTNEAKGNLSTNYYIKPATHMSGVSKYRMVYKQKDGFVEYSPEVTFKSSRTPLNFYPAKVQNNITFINNNKKAVKYKIYTLSGKVVLEGEGTEIDCTSLTDKEVYTLYFDNQKKAFQKVRNKKK